MNKVDASRTWLDGQRYRAQVEKQKAESYNSRRSAPGCLAQVILFLSRLRK